MEVVMEMPYKARHRGTEAQRHRGTEEIPLSNRRMENREILQRLFQGYVRDFGSADGWKIIRTIVFELGGMRILIPCNGNCRGEALQAFNDHLCQAFGKGSAPAIMQKFLVELGGLRISFPTFEELHRQERNERIRNKIAEGMSAVEIADMMGVTPHTVRRIVRGED